MNPPTCGLVLRLGAAVALVLACLLDVSAADTGMITGRISNAATGAYLEGAQVSIVGQPAVAHTARDGSFTLAAPSGVQNVRVYYTGLEIATKPVSVAAGQSAELNVALTSAVQLMAAFAVSGSREGEAASITKQRNAPNVVNVVAIETFGDVADGNLGNFMVRLPGVAAEETSNGDIIGVKIRGTPAELNSVNLDGVRMSNAVSGFSPMGDRATMLDQLPAEFIKEVEVHKALTPAMPADAIGGATNLITKSALDFSESILTYKLGASYNTYRDSLGNFKPTATLSYLTRAGKNRRLGVALSLSYNITETPRDRVQVQRADADGRMGLARTLAEVNTRERAGTGLKFDYRFDPDTAVTVKLNYALYHYEGFREIAAASATGSRRIADYNQVSRAQIAAGAVPVDSARQAAGIAPGFTDAFTEMLNATWTNEMGRVVRYGRNYLGELAATRKLAGDQKLSVQASYNPSWFDADLPTLTTILTNGTTTAAAGIGLAIDARENRSRPLFVQTYGPNVAFNGAPVALYTGVYSTGRGRTEEEISNAQADYTKEFRGERQSFQVKAGLNWRRQHRWVYTTAYSWRVVGADGVAMRNVATGQNDDLAPFREAGPGYGLFNGLYAVRDKFDISAVERASRLNPGWFVPTATPAAPTINEATEDVSAGYVQGRVRFGKLGVLGGVRFERTDLLASGRVTDPRHPAVTRTKVESDYHAFFPSLHFTYSFRSNLIAHTSFSTGSSRPGMSNLYPVTTVSYDASGGGTVSQNDVGLKPQYSRNYDASLEYYFEPAGVLSFGAFRKDLTDFLAREIRQIGSGTDNGFGGLYAGFDHSTTTNQGTAKIEGIELNYMQQLTMLPKPLDRLQVFANLTDLKTEGRYAAGAEELAKFVPRTTNMGLSYQWRAFQVRVAQRYTSAFLDGYNANVYQRTRFRPDRKLDVSFKYQFRRWAAVYVDVLNVFNKWPDQYTGSDEGRVQFSNVYGTRINFGLNGRF